MNLDITEAKAEKLGELESKAMDVLLGVMNGALVDDQAKVAMQVMNTVAKSRQTLTAREGIRFSMVKHVANKEEMRQYITSTQPQIKKLVSSGRKPKKN